MTAHDSLGDRDPFDEVAEAFVARYRRGERPSITEYVDQHPHLADRIRRLFPTLAAIEQVVPADERLAAPLTRSGAAGTPEWEQLGDYRIIRELGRGGMGIVYEAEQQSLGRRVALKVLMTPTLIDSGRRERFLREARAAARLHHTNIVPVYGTGEERGICYYAMQLIAGRGLDEVLGELRRLHHEAPARHPVPTEASLRQAVGSSSVSSGLSDRTYWRSVARVGLQVAEALGYAHAQGLIHRDIKPSNLLLDVQGNIWITDFGLAKAEDDGDLTRSGDIIGTLRYLAPERLRGHADARSDVYSLGLTLYELATMQAAFTTADRSVLIHQVAQQQPERPRRINPEVPHDLETVILKCIAKDPADRYRRADDLAADLRCVLENRPIQARRTAAHERLWRWCRRNPAIAALTTCVALLLCILASGGTATAWKLSRQNEAIRRSLQRTQDAEREARLQADNALGAEAAQRALRITANRQLFASYLAQARAQFGTRRPGQRNEALQAVRAAAAVADDIQLAEEDRRRLTDDAAAALSQFDLAVRETWRDELPPTSQNRVCFSADGTLFARAEPGHRLVVRRIQDGTVVQEWPLGDAIPDDRPRPYLSPAGNYLLAKGAGEDGRQQVACVWRLGSDENESFCARVALGGSRFDQALDMAADSQSFVCCGPDGHVQQRGLADGVLLATLPRTSVPDGLRLSPDGQQLLAWTASDVDITDLSTGHTAVRLSLPARIDCAAWCSDGNIVACGGEDGHIYVVDARDGSVLRQCVGHQSEVRELAFHPHTDLLASSSWDGTVRLWDLRHGKEVLRTLGAVGTFSRCGRWLGFVADQHTGRWEVSGIPWSMVLATGDETVRSVRFSRDGLFLFVGSPQGAAVWDARIGRRLANLPGAMQALEHPTRDIWVTAGKDGVMAWPRRQEAHTIRIGPPHVLVPLPCDSINMDHAGQRWLATSDTQLYYWDSEPAAQSPERRAQDRLQFADLSSDGRWIAASGWNVPDIPIWTAGQRDSVAKLRAPRGGWIAFSPDSSLLAVSLLDQYILYRTDTWMPMQAFPSRAPQFGAVAWAPDGHALALVPEPGKLQIMDIATGRPRLTMELPEGERISALTFSPDGRKLAAGVRGGDVHLWNLDQLSAELAALRLGDTPDESAHKRVEQIDTADPVRLVLDGG